MNQSESENFKGDHQPNAKKYGRKYCIKAKCVFNSSLDCKKNLYPTNDNKAKRLYKSSGYCDSYLTEFEEIFRDKALRILQKEQDKFVRKLSREISRIEQIPKEEFAHNIASPQFNPTALIIFLSLENNLDKYYRSKKHPVNTEIDKICETLSEASEIDSSTISIFPKMINDLKSNSPVIEEVKTSEDENLIEAVKLKNNASETYQEIKEALIEICNRGFGGRTYKQKTQIFITKHRLIQKEYAAHIKFLKKYRTKLLLRNKLFNGLFAGLKNSLEITQSDLTPKDYFYFRDYYDNKLGIFYRNYGRKRVNDALVDYYLCPSRNLYYEDDPHNHYRPFYFVPYSKVEPIPIFKLLRKKKQYAEIQNIYTLEIVKLLYASHKKIYTIHFSTKFNPDRPQKPSRIDYFFNPQSSGGEKIK